MENLKKLERRMALKMCCNLWPGILALVFLAGLFLWSAQYEEPDSHVVMQIWSLYGTLIGFYAIIMIIPFVVSALGPHFSIKCLSAGEQSRIDEDCMKGYRFGDGTVCWCRRRWRGRRRFPTGICCGSTWINAMSIM